MVGWCSLMRLCQTHMHIVDDCIVVCFPCSCCPLSSDMSPQGDRRCCFGNYLSCTYIAAQHITNMTYSTAVVVVVRFLDTTIPFLVGWQKAEEGEGGDHAPHRSCAFWKEAAMDSCCCCSFCCDHRFRLNRLLARSLAYPSLFQSIN